MQILDPNNLPNDVESLKALLLESQTENNRLSKRTLALSQQLAVMEQQLAALRRARFGKSSEKLDANIYQMELMIEDLESTIAELDDDSEKPEPKTKTQKARRQPLPESLPRETHIHGVNECCGDCGHKLELIREDVSEQLEYKPASFRVIRHVRPKYRCDGCESLVQAPAPSKPIPKSYAGPALLAHVAVAKYCDHLPLYRQSAIYSREGIELSRSTLADWVGKVCHLLRPLEDALKRYALDTKHLHTDDTPVAVLQPGRKTTKQGRLLGLSTG